MVRKEEGLGEERAPKWDRTGGQGSTPEHCSGFLLVSPLLVPLFPGDLKLLPASISDGSTALPSSRSRISG